MSVLDFLGLATALAPAAVLSSGTLGLLALAPRGEAVWRPFRILLGVALIFALANLILLSCAQSPITSEGLQRPFPGIEVNQTTVWMAGLVQLLGTVIGVFSSRYLQGERGPHRYAIAFAGVLASVHLLVLANHWLVLIGAWAAAGVALQHLLCFYQDRPFALLAAHKKRIADRLADLLLLAAAGLAWVEVGSGSLSELQHHLAQYGGSAALQSCAVCLVVAVILRTALFPVHGWLIQVMEAPTPVSALLHAGVINLGGYLLIRFAPLIEAAAAARWLLVAFGLSTALLAGLVMLTRISVKVRLAWSTVAQMGFMILECGLGLYTLAALHLIGHSLYKAHAFLSASSAVRETRLKIMAGRNASTTLSQILAPTLSIAVVACAHWGVAADSWPWWWNGILGFAWAPLLWLPAKCAAEHLVRAVAGIVLVAGLTLVALLAHELPLGVRDAPFDPAGWVALVGMALMYLSLVGLQRRSGRLSAWRRWSYAGFYVDEFYTRLALWLWPAAWTPGHR